MGKRSPGKELSPGKEQQDLSGIVVVNTSSPGRPSLLQFTLIFIYKNLYFIGVSLLRKKLKYTRMLKAFSLVIVGTAHALVYRLHNWVRRQAVIFAEKVLHPFKKTGQITYFQKTIIADKKRKNKLSFTDYLPLVNAYSRLVLKILSTILNYTAPLLTAFVLMFLINGFVNQSLGLEVTYLQQRIGYIENESDFDKATADVRNRLISVDDFVTAVPEMQLVAIESHNEENYWIKSYNKLLRKLGFKLVVLEKYTDTKDIANQIIRLSGKEIESAYGLYINNQFYGAIKDKIVVLDELEGILKRASSGKQGEKVSFEKSIKLEKGLFPVSSIVEEASLTQLLSSDETVEETYTVKANDTPILISAATGVSLELLREMNPGIDDSLQIGDTIKTAVARPFLNVKSSYITEYEEDFPFETIETQNAIYARGYRNVEQEGVPGLRFVKAEVTTVNGIEINRSIVESKVLKEPVPEKVTVGVNNPIQAAPPSAGSSPSSDASNTPSSYTPSVSSTGFLWPTTKGYVSCELGGYPGHTGMDIATDVGTPVLAAAPGVVATAKYSYLGYGNHIVIQHSDGFTTLYAHNSELYVSVGDQVAQGQIIAASGRSGNVTGPHLHFEVRVYGSVQNPRKYVSQ